MDIYNAAWKAKNILIDITRRIPHLAVKVFIYRVVNKLFRLANRTFWAPASFGSSILCDPHDIIQRMILIFGEWEPSISYVTKKILKPGDVYVDVGANIGYYTLLASRSVGNRGKVVSIEASPTIFSMLEGNVRANNPGNVRLINIAASDAPGVLTLYSCNPGNLGSTTTTPRRGQPVEATVNADSLDSILTPDEIARVKMIKVDIEGAELPVLTRFLDTISLYPPTAVILVEASVEGVEDAWRAVFSRFTEACFLAYRIDNVYTPEWYLDWSPPTFLSQLTDIPETLTDILFSRQPISIA